MEEPAAEVGDEKGAGWRSLLQMDGLRSDPLGPEGSLFRRVCLTAAGWRGGWGAAVSLCGGAGKTGGCLTSPAETLDVFT